MYRIAVIIMAGIIAGLAVASIALMTAVAHDQPLHRAYACQFAKDYRHEVHLPAAPCDYP